MPEAIRIASLVEGAGEVLAVPVLLRRLLPSPPFEILKPIKLSKGSLLSATSGALERAVELAARQVGVRGGLLILLDADRDCPATVGPRLLQRARQARSDLPIGLVLAKAEFECWFLAAAVSLRSTRGLPSDLEPPSEPESVSGAKEWLRKRAGRYSPTLDQAALTQRFDLEEARNRSPSFDKCVREIERLRRAWS